METRISTVGWQQSLALNSTPIIFDIPYQQVDIYPVKRSNESFLHSEKLKQSILESKKVFLNHSLRDEKPKDEQMEEKPLLGVTSDTKRSPCKKISFKIKRQSSLCKRNVTVPRVTNIPINKVAELTKKFNEMVENRNVWEEQRVKMVIKRGESLNSDKKPSEVHRDSVKVSRKPSVKTKPTHESKNLVIIKTRKSSIKREKSNANAKQEQAARPTTLNLNLNIPKAIIETSPNGTSVKAAIEIFEKKSTTTSPTSKAKPVIPEKSALVKNLGKTATLPSSYRLKHKQSHLPVEVYRESTPEFTEDKVEVINIPAVLPQRRCDSMYETLNMKKVQPPALKAKSVDNLNELKRVSVLPNTSFLWKDKSSASTSSRSSINTQFQERLNVEESKKLPPDIPPKPTIECRKPAPKLIKKKMPLPTENEEDLDDYEEIGVLVTEEIILTEEKFKGYDEITKPVNDVEVVDTLVPEVVSEATSSDDKHYEEISREEKIYEELTEMCTKLDDGYEPIGNKLHDASENIYETLPVPPVPLRRQQQEPLPPRPPSSTTVDETTYNCYESIYTKKDGYYESIYGSQLTTDSGSNRDSVLSSDHKSNSLYGQSMPRWDYNSDSIYYKPPSDISDRASDRSDEWEDVTDNEEGENRIIVVREKSKGRKSGWSQHFRDQLSKTLKEAHTSQAGDENDHHYESLYTAKEDEDLDYDSFESDTESETSLDKIRVVNDSGIDISNNKLPDPPQSYGIMKFAEKNMKKISRNFTMNLTKSLTRMRRHMSKTETELIASNKENKKPDQTKPKNYENVETKNPALRPSVYSNTEPVSNESQSSEEQSKQTLSRSKTGGGFLTKFRRSMSLSTESANELTSNLNGGNKTKSTFYLTEAIDIDDTTEANNDNSDKSLSPVLRQSKSPLMRPRSPPPPAPMYQSELRKSSSKNDKSSSWYADSGVFRNNDQAPIKRPNTFWYAEVGLYQPQSNSTPSTSSAENSGSNLSTPIKPFELPRPVLKNSDFINQDDKEHFNNVKNESAYYTESFNSFSSNETKKDESLMQEIQLRLQDEPLYQFYDAAVVESIHYTDTSDMDSDNYEDVSEKEVISNVIKIRPSAMELVTPNRNSICFTKTLWCEIPEVINSSVLSTLSAHQKKLQEAKFEILTSEASYLNSLNVLNNHFVKNFSVSNLLSKEEKEVLFGHVEEVRNSSEKLLHDLEKCWQDNILLHGICDIIQKHAEENFNVYVPYCQNQILFDETLKSLKDRLGFIEFLRHLELSETCQSLSLYSFLMLPMQRITRWPLLVDAVLKRLPEQDPEYYACQFALATVNKIVNQCNEAARQKERETELLKIAKQLEFPPSVPKIPIITTDRWLIRRGSAVQMQSRNEDAKLTFGKRFSKIPVYLFLFNDLFIVAKERGENAYVVQQYCPRNLVELSTSEVTLTVPAKEAQGKHLIFVTVLENHDGKTVEYLLSCGSESDKERWLEALTPPKSEDPEETLYECWDCPQVSAVHNYAASQPDELALSKGDVINVLRKMADGWYHGERIRDGQTGWFPANHTVEIANFHVRARNLKQRYRLLAFSENYLKSK